MTPYAQCTASDSALAPLTDLTSVVNEVSLTFLHAHVEFGYSAVAVHFERHTQDMHSRLSWFVTHICSCFDSTGSNMTKLPDLSGFVSCCLASTINVLSSVKSNVKSNV